MKIANIVFEKDLINHNHSDYVNYYNEPISYDKLNKSLPTLYVGWSVITSYSIHYTKLYDRLS